MEIMEFNTLYDQPATETILDTSSFNERHPGVNLHDPNVMVVYKITDKTNGKIYVGKTKNIYRRAREYINPIKSNLKPMSALVLQKGVENFVMEPIAFTDNAASLANLEMMYIIQLDTMNPEIGYNVSLQSVITPDHIGNRTPRKQFADERIRRSKMMCAINPDTKEMVFSTGLKLFADRIARSKDEIKSAARRAGSLDGYYFYYLGKADEIAQLNFASNPSPKSRTDYSDFFKCHEYMLAYITKKDNPENYTVRFIHQDDTTKGYTYDDVDIAIQYINKIRDVTHQG